MREYNEYDDYHVLKIKEIAMIIGFSQEDTKKFIKTFLTLILLKIKANKGAVYIEDICKFDIKNGDLIVSLDSEEGFLGKLDNYKTLIDAVKESLILSV
jgi:hypothetical protein